MSTLSNFNRLTKYLITFSMCLVTVVILLLIDSLSQEKQLAKVSERVFDTSIRKIAFSRPMPGKSILSNSIVVTDNKILFYDGSGMVFSERDYDKVKSGIGVSKQGKYLYVTEYTKLPTKEEIGYYKRTIINSENKPLWGYTGEFEYEGRKGPGLVYLSDKDGSAVFVNPSTCTFEFYDNKGNLIKEIQPFGDVYQLARGLYCEFSDDGTYFAVNVQEREESGGGGPLTKIPLRGALKGQKITRPGYPPKSGNPYIFLFDYRGNELWRRPIPEGVSEGVGVSFKSEYIIAGRYTYTFKKGKVSERTLLFDRKGQKIGEYDFYFNNYSFSEDAQFVTLCRDKKIGFIQTNSGNILWEKAMTDRIISLSVSEKGEYVLVETGKKDTNESQSFYANPKIFLFDRHGIEIISKDFSGEKCPYEYGRFDYATLSSDGKTISLLFKEKFVSYQIEK